MQSVAVEFTKTAQGTQAMSLMEEAVTLSRARLGNSAPQTVQAMKLLQSIYLKQGLAAKAAEITAQLAKAGGR